MKETIAQKALRLLEPIPKENWITGTFSDGKGKCCLIGHWIRLNNKNPNNYDADECSDYRIICNSKKDIRGITARFIRETHNTLGDGSSVNNWPTVNGYTEPEIKDRCIHLLKDMVEAGY